MTTPGRKPSFLKALAADPGGSHQLVNQRHGHVVAVRLLCAFDSTTRRTGLLHHDALLQDEAMIIAPSNAIHTFFMRFAIDAAFVSRDGAVLKTYRALKAWRMAAALNAFAVIELSAGALARTDTKTGDVLVVQSQVPSR